MTEIMVLGAGMVGVSTALALQAVGRTVVLIDRKPPGRETSYGNAGVIQAEAVEPYALPLDPASLVRLALRQGNDVHYHLNALPSHIRPLWRYALASRPGRHRVIAATYAQLALRSTADHAPLIAAAGVEHLISRTGLRIAYRSERAFAAGAAEAERLRHNYGPPMAVLDSAAMAAAEPGLKLAMAGAVHWQGSWSCRDPGGLTRAYADLFVARGGAILTADAGTLRQTATGWAVTGSIGAIDAPSVVIALGPWSPALLERFGYRVPMLRKRGYHRHFSNVTALNAPLMDQERATVISPMVQGLRVLTAAELARVAAPPTPVQLNRSTLAAGELLDLGAPIEAEPWFGNRPCMPDMLPLVGAATRHRGLWFHFGHGHQGFTQGPTTAALLAEEITTGLPPMPALAPHRMAL